MTGYSEKTLIEKLGYLPGDTVVLLNSPEWFTKELENSGINPLSKLPATWCHGFLSQVAELFEFLNEIDLSQIEKGLWVSWPKKAAKIPTDLTEQSFRDMILLLGWVDTKVCAIDDTWSGLKFIRRKVN